MERPVQSAGHPLKAEAARAEVQMDELRLVALRAVVLAVAAIAVVLFVYLGLGDWTASRLWHPVLALGATAALGAAAARLGVRLASALLVAGLLATLADSLYLYPGSLLAALGCLIVLVAGVLLRWRWGALVAAGAAAIVARGALASPGVVPADVAALALVLIWGGLFLAWLISRPAAVALDWAWSSYEQALRKTEEARDRQAELERIAKSLNEAYTRLEHANQELERARRAAAEARRLKAAFAANISHELRTPLNLIIGFGEMMVMAPHTYEGEVLPDRYRGDVEAMYRNARHLSTLIDDVLDLSQIEAGRMGLSKEPVVIAEVVREAAATVAGMFEKRGLYLDVDVPADLPTAYVDRTRVRQVIINLLGNAARFTERGGVRISVRQQGHDLVVDVADTGIGVDPKELSDLFEEFYQVDSSLRRRYGGSGLGLAISKQFVELHGGSMWAESVPGGGSTFRFTLPLLERVAATTLRADWETWARADEPRDRPALVVVDDDPSVQRVFRRYLDGYRVVAAADPGETAAVVQAARARAVIVVSPELVAGARPHLPPGLPPRLPVVVCALQSGLDAYKRLGVAECLLKPISRERLLGALARLARPPRSILVVDDDPEMVRLIGMMIRSQRGGTRLRRAYSGAAALALMRQRRPDAVVLDLLMPEMGGWAVLEEMRADARLHDVPVIVVTARGGPSEAVEARSVSITRDDGLSVGELMRCVRASLDSLLRPDSAPRPSAAPAE